MTLKSPPPCTHKPNYTGQGGGAEAGNDVAGTHCCCLIRYPYIAAKRSNLWGGVQAPGLDPSQAQGNSTKYRKQSPSTMTEGEEPKVDPQPSTLNPQPSTLNPQPSTLIALLSLSLCVPGS